MKVLLKRLLETAGIDPSNMWEWPGSEKFTYFDVATAIYDGNKGISEPYGDTWKHPAKSERNKDYHIGRIIYFFYHSKEISNIEVDNPCFESYILPGCIIIDGYHRLAAAIILNLEYVDISYGGREDVLNYLLGKTDILPDQFL